MLCLALELNFGIPVLRTSARPMCCSNQCIHQQSKDIPSTQRENEGTKQHIVGLVGVAFVMKKCAEQTVQWRKLKGCGLGARFVGIKNIFAQAHKCRHFGLPWPRRLPLLMRKDTHVSFFFLCQKIKLRVMSILSFLLSPSIKRSFPETFFCMCAIRKRWKLGWHTHTQRNEMFGCARTLQIPATYKILFHRCVYGLETTCTLRHLKNREGGGIRQTNAT